MPILKNAKHELFAQKCAKAESEDAAYAAAYPSRKPGASRRGSASELRSNPIIAARILEIQQEGATQAIAEIKEELVTRNMVLKGLLEIAQVDIAEAYSEDGNTLKSIHEIPQALRRSISGIEVLEEFEMVDGRRVFTGYTKKLKFWDKTKSWELLGKHLKLFTDKIELNGNFTLEDLVAPTEKPKP